MCNRLMGSQLVCTLTPNRALTCAESKEARNCLFNSSLPELAPMLAPPTSWGGSPGPDAGVSVCNPLEVINWLCRTLTYVVETASL